MVRAGELGVPPNTPPLLDGGPQWGWPAFILPNLDQAPLFNQLRVNELRLSQVAGTPAFDATKTPLAVFRCPSDSGAKELLRGTPDQRHFNNAAWNSSGAPNPNFVATSNYVGVMGNRDRQPWWFAVAAGSRVAEGVFAHNGGTSFRDISDGPSNTFAVGERSWKCNAAAWVGNRNPQGGQFLGHFYTLGRVGDAETIANNGTSDGHPIWPAPLNAPFTTPLERQRMCSEGFASAHEGGAFFLFCDGSVKFISENIDYRDGTIERRIWRNIGVYNRLGIKDDEFPVGEF